MELRFYPFSLQFRHPFRIAHGERSQTPVVYVEFDNRGIIGYGEAALPPYLKESQETVIQFLEMVREQLRFKTDSATGLLQFCEEIRANNYPGCAAFEMALLDWIGKSKNITTRSFLGIHDEMKALAVITIGMSGDDELPGKLEQAQNFHLLKIKGGSENDFEKIKSLRKLTDKPICVDANQGWKSKEQALEMIHFLNDHNTLFVEQPFHPNEKENARWLKERSPLPIIADEAVQHSRDLVQIIDEYHGINVKLMKCGGMMPALELIHGARKLGMKVLIGCMSESSCGTGAASQLAPLADWVDLDGPLLITNDPFYGMEYHEGQLVLSNHPGNGIFKR